MARGLARSRERARSLIMSGVVRVEGRLADKAGALVPEEAAVAIVTPDHPFVGRGGVKLSGALEDLGIDPAGRIALDIGASTGGFTDCLLRSGAAKVYALDVGRGQLDWSLRRDPRVVVLEGRNARYLTPRDLPERVALAVVDVSFISLRLIFPVLPDLLAEGADLLALVKPQFEVGRADVGPGGIVKDRRLHLAALHSVAAAAADAGLGLAGGCASRLAGAEGNQEFFLHLVPGRKSPDAGEVARILGGIVDGEDESSPSD